MDGLRWSCRAAHRGTGQAEDAHWPVWGEFGGRLRRLHAVSGDGVNRPTWTPLVDLRPKSEIPKQGGRARAPAPLLIQFPDHTETRPSYDGTTGTVLAWKYVLREIVRWLSDHGYLRPEHCPIGRPNLRTKYIVHTVPKHFDGSQFTNLRKVGQFYVEDKEPSGQTVQSVRIVIERVAPRLLSDFLVREQYR